MAGSERLMSGRSGTVAAKHDEPGALMKRSAALFLLLAAGCGSDATVDRTLATLETVRGGASVGEHAAPRIARGAAEQEITIAERGLSRLSLDSGAQLLLDASTQVSIVDEQTLRLTRGRLFAETGEGDELFLEGPAGSLRASDAALSAQITDGALVAYVVRGEVSWSAGEARGIAGAGQVLTLSASSGETTPAALWEDWTGGLARPGPGDAGGPAGVGVLEARVPDEVGLARWPLVIRRLDVRVRVVGDLATTEVEQVFFNPASETVEGLYRIRVPEEAVLQRFAVDRNGRMVDGYVREQQQARAAYEAQVYRGSTLDPALLEWVAPGRYQARIYPIQPGESRRIVIRYAEWLTPIGADGPRLYRFPMGGGRRAPRVQELSIAVDLADAGAEHVRAGMGAAIEEGEVRLRRSDFAPRSDFWLELTGTERAQRAWRAPHEPPPRAPDARQVVNEADERDYWYLPLRLPEALAERAASEGRDLVIVADVSAATDRAHLELGRSVVEAITAHLGANDRVAIVTSDLTIRPLGGDQAALGEASSERVEAMLDALARAPAGGATDLGEAIGAAAALLDPARPSAIVYVGDGAPTVGELEAEGLLDRLARLPSPPRLYAVAVGGESHLELLETLTRGGGLALRVEERSAAADAALSLLAHLARPVAQRVTIDVGTGIENVYPRRPVDVVIGDVLPVVGRVREAPPAQVVVRGTIAGEEFEETIAITTEATESAADLRLRWAGERLRQLLLEGAQREEIAELGTRYGLITPFTSYYVPSAQELSQLGASALLLIERPHLLAEARRARRNAVADGLLGLALGPLSIGGCSSRDSEAASAPQGEVAADMAMEEAPDPSGAMGGAPGAPSSNRYGIEGPGSDPHMAREQARAEAAAPPAEPMAQAAPSPDVAMPSTAAPILPQGGFADAPADSPLAGLDGLGAAEPPPPPRSARSTGTEIIDPFGGGGGGFVGSGSGYGGGGGADQRARARPARMRRPTSSLHVVDQHQAERDGRPAFAEGTEWGADETNQRGRLDLGGLADGDTTIRITTVTERANAAHATAHARTRCSDAAELPLADRSALWNERLGQAGGPSGWVDVYRRAVRDCEAPSWRDRRALLGLVINHAGSVDRMLQVVRLFDSGAARGFLRAAILRRVRSPQDLRAVRAAFGLGDEPDWTLVEQILERASGPEGRVRALRRLAMQYPDSFDLKLRLLEVLETNGHPEEARRLADRLRADPRSDAGVRTAVGEMLVRMDRVDEARRVFSEIVEFEPLSELARRRLGDLYRAHGWFEDAYRQYQTLATIRPDDPTVLLLLAQAAAGTGRIDEALRLEQRLMETAQPGAENGIARIAQLWSSVRLAKLRVAARETDNEARRQALEQRMRRSGVLAGAGDLRVTLVWSHPDAQLALYASHPGEGLTRPSEIAPEHGIEAFDVPEQEDGSYRLEVRRADPSSPTAMSAELVMIWHEGRADEVVRIVPLTFAEGRDAYSWILEGSALSEGGT